MRFAMHVTESVGDDSASPTIVEVIKEKMLASIGMKQGALKMDSKQLKDFKKSVAQNELSQYTEDEVDQALSGQGTKADDINEALEKEMAKVSEELFKEQYDAAVTGDTVGDPLKDTSGPSLNILMKLMAIISVVFAPFFVAHSLNAKDVL